MPRPGSNVLIAILALLALICGASISRAQSNFIRDDAYDFYGFHNLAIVGDHIDSLEAVFSSDADFRSFKVRAIPGGQRIYDPGHGLLLQVGEIDVDLDGDGLFELRTNDMDDGGTTGYRFPEPPNGVKAQGGIAVKVRFRSLVTGGMTTIERTLYAPITIYSAPRVYHDVDGNTIVQIRNQSASGKTAVLMVEGIDPINTVFPDTYYTMGFDFIHGHLFPADCEVFILNFANGGASLRENAAVIRNALDAVHDLCPERQIMLAGFSMGGVASRYALASAEQDGLEHNVGLFVSFDSPQNGAHANRPLQDFIRYSAPNDNRGVQALRATLQTPAAKEMLDYNVYDTENSRALFYAELNGLNGDGYPDKCFNAAVSNGRYAASYGRSFYNTALGWFRVLERDGSVSQSVALSSERRDVGPGSLQIGLSKFRTMGVLIQLYQLYHWNRYYQFEINYEPVYMPTWSTLDLRGYHFSEDNYEDTDLVPPYVSKFDATSVQTSQPLPHNALSVESAATILNWMQHAVSCRIEYELAEGGGVPPDQLNIPILVGAIASVDPKIVNVPGRGQVTYVFAHWEDGSTENPRRFFSPRDTVHRATMKVHLASSVSGDAWPNASRRLVEESDGTHATRHAVYESGGDIWYLRNQQGFGWEPEVALAGPAGGGSAPALATRSWGHEGQVQVYVAWLQSGGAFGYRVSNVDNGATWRAPVTRWLSYAPGAPVLPDGYCMLWGDAEAAGGAVLYYKLPESNGVGDPLLVPGTEGGGSSPAAIAVGVGEYRLAYERDGVVWYCGFRDPNVLDPWAQLLSTDAPVALSTAGWVGRTPSIANIGDKVFVAWEADSGGVTRIAVKERNAGVWGSTTYFSHAGHIVGKPVMGVDGAHQNVHLLWQCGAHVARASRGLSSTTWTSVVNIGEGRSPAISSAWSGVSAMWATGAFAPFSLSFADTMPPDVTSPATVLDLGPEAVTSDGVYLVWTESGDDGTSGQAASYEVRVSMSGAIDSEAAWEAAEIVASGLPVMPGVSELVATGGFLPHTYYYFAVRVRDEYGNVSGISNCPRVRTLVDTYDDPEGGAAVAAAALAMVGGGADGKRFVMAWSTMPDTASLRVIALAGSSGGSRDSAVTRVTKGAEAEDSTSIVLGDFEVGLGLRARACSVVLGPGWQPVGLERMATLAESPSVCFGIESIELAGPGGSAPVDSSDWESCLTTCEVGDTLLIRYARIPSTGSGEQPVWVTVRGNPVVPVLLPTSLGRTRGDVAVRFGLSVCGNGDKSGATHLRFTLPAVGMVRLEVFDVTGRKVRTLLRGFMEAGEHDVHWDGRDDQGQMVARGLYIARAVNASKQVSAKFLRLTLQ